MASWIGEVFGRERGEQIDLKDIALLFHRTREMDVLERPDNNVILGAKGSGKSTALRALSWNTWLKRASNVTPPFVGVYVPMGYDEVAPFCLSFAEHQTTDLFEHFFGSTFVLEACKQLTGVDFAELELLPLFTTYLKEGVRLKATSLMDIATLFSEERQAALKRIRKDCLDGSLGKLVNLAQALTVRTVSEVGERLSLAHMHSPRMPERLGILLDSFDYYGLLGRKIAPLLQSDSSSPVVVKVAARTLDVREVLRITETRPLEAQRDYDICSLDRDADDEEHMLLVREALCRRVRTLGPDSATSLTDEGIIGLLFQGSTSDPSDLASFESFVRLSSGNVLAVILLLDGAARLQKAQAKIAPVGLTSLERNHRLQSVRTASDKFWANEIGVRVPHHTHEATVFCETALEFAKREVPSLSYSPKFVLPQISPESQPLVANMLASRILTASDMELNIRAQCNEGVTGPVEFELNRTLLPKHGLLPSPGPSLSLTSQFRHKYREALAAQKPFLSPRSTRSQRELFGMNDFNVFISLPFDNKKKARTTVLRTAINRLYLEKTARNGGELVAFTDIHCIPHVGSFRHDIPNYIRDSTYMVADISELGIGPGNTPGVFYEIGLGVALRKPLALFYNCRIDKGIPKFEAQKLPPLLRGQTVLVWSADSVPFIEVYSRAHEKLLAYGGQYDQPLDGRRPTAVGSNVPHAFLSFQPRHRDAEAWVEGVIRRLFPGIQIEKSRDWQRDDAPHVVRVLSSAEIRIIDCTSGINAQALELGMATATGERRTLEVWNTKSDETLNPVSMYPGARFTWSDMGAEDEHQLVTILQGIARSTTLGTVRP